jgi:tRNA nucleotidyltransferase/poly(A) polymerase
MRRVMYRSRANHRAFLVGGAVRDLLLDARHDSMSNRRIPIR